MQLTNRVAVITGGKRIGRVVAHELARRGVHVALSYKSSRAVAEATADEIRALGTRALTCAADVTNASDCELLMRRAADDLGSVDFLINMASVYESTPYDSVTEAIWQAELQANLTSAFLCAKAAVPYMERAGGGRIVSFSDWVARSGRPRYPGFLAYYVAKAGVIALTEGLALELAARHILVNAIAAGPIVPPPDLPGDDVKAVADATPLGRWGGEEEIAKAVVLLLETDFITGETIRVDGGRHVR
ncbi:MAG: SDR family NAD(P)-dependent oxidoreductase [Vicinamibacterales bacterium]